MTLPSHPIPAPGFTMISGKRNPPDDGAKYVPQYRNGWIDSHEYTASQLRWKHIGCDWDVAAIRKVGG